MKWLPSFGKKSVDDQTEVKSADRSMVIGLDDTMGSLLTMGTQGGATPAKALSLYDQSTAVSVPVNMIAEAFASIKPVIKRGDDIIDDHPVLDLLSNPSPFYDRTLFMETIAKHYLITTNAYIAGVGGLNRLPLELQPISPANVNPVEGQHGYVQNFVVGSTTLPGSYVMDRRSRNRGVRYMSGNLRELFQIRGFSTRNNGLLSGQSPLVSAGAEVRAHIMGTKHNVSLLEKGGRMSLVFHFDEDMTPEEFEETKSKVRKQYGGYNAAGEIGVTSGGKLDIKEIGVNNKDMDFAALQAMVKEALALQYKVPLPLVTVKASTLDNYKQGKLALYDDAVLPLADRIFGGLTRMLIPRAGGDPSREQITYDMDNITALATRRNEELKLRKELRIETINEMRADIGREPLDGGDDVYISATEVPIGTDPFAGTEPANPDADPGLARDSDDNINVDDDEEDESEAEEE